MTLSTPAILFSAITLIMLAHTNRFFSLGKLIRDIHAHKTGESEELENRQLPLLHRRLKLVKYMQATGVIRFLFCTASTLLVFLGLVEHGKAAFAASILFLSVSLLFSLWEVLISTQALEMVLKSCEQDRTEK